MNAILLSEKSEKRVRCVYTEKHIERLSKLVDLPDHIYNKEEVLKERECFGDVRFIFSTGGMPEFDKEEIAEIFPRLEAVFYAAGSVQRFARPFLESGIQVFSAWAANGIPVAEYTFAQITLAMKGFYQATGIFKEKGRSASRDFVKNFPGNYDSVVGLIGAGMIGKLVIEKLCALRLKVLVFDPFLPDEKAKELGVEKVDLATLFSSCHVISNHLANNEATRGILKKEHFAAMRPYATFINTGRGAQVSESDLIEVLQNRPDLTAVLDVTFPEPPEDGSSFYTLPNVFLTPHIAGSEGNEVRRMTDYMLEEAEAYLSGKATRYGVTLKMLETMA
ncbi:MAG: hydroxyacid dehydrogenase [Clostridia bacterium]|nr:hydroxyacid dehydrogenase [Clostridia bacterium]